MNRSLLSSIDILLVMQLEAVFFPVRTVQVTFFFEDNWISLPPASGCFVYTNWNGYKPIMYMRMLLIYSLLFHLQFVCISPRENLDESVLTYTLGLVLTLRVPCTLVHSRSAVRRTSTVLFVYLLLFFVWLVELNGLIFCYLVSY
jgi:hypothetical protein